MFLSSRLNLCVALSLFLTLACGFAGEPNPAMPPNPLDQKVKDAVEKGKAFLLAKADGTGLFEGQYKDKIGSAALVVCALRKAGVPPEHEAIKKTIERIYIYADSKMDADSKMTYDCGLCLLALDAVNHPSDPNYAPTLDLKAKTAAEKLAFQLLKSRGPRGGWFYFGKTDGDMSTSQYGALGLWAASRLGIPIQPPIWDGVAVYVLRVHQKENGGFSYHDQIKKADPAIPSITAAAIGTLALAFRQSSKKEIVREIVIDDYDKDKKTEKKTITVETKKPNTELEKAIERGFAAWAGMGFDQKNAYYWYAAERACTLTNTKMLGKLPWFETLANQILPLQKDDGSWINGHDATCDTSWALLALTRSTGQMIHKTDEYDYNGASKPAAAKPDAPKPEAPKSPPPPETKKPEPNKPKPVDE